MYYSISNFSVASIDAHYRGKEFGGSSSFEVVDGQIRRVTQRRPAANMSLAQSGVYVYHTASQCYRDAFSGQPLSTPPTAPSPANVVGNGGEVQCETEAVDFLKTK